jgi:hypothetical protein
MRRAARFSRLTVVLRLLMLKTVFGAATEFRLNLKTMPTLHTVPVEVHESLHPYFSRSFFHRVSRIVHSDGEDRQIESMAKLDTILSDRDESRMLYIAMYCCIVCTPVVIGTRSQVTSR